MSGGEDLCRNVNNLERDETEGGLGCNWVYGGNRICRCPDGFIFKWDNRMDISRSENERVLCGWKENSSNFSTRVENKNIWINKMEVRNEGTREYEANQKKN